MSHMCKSHVTHVMSHVTRVQSHVTPSITWGEQKEQKRGMSRSKLGWNLPVFLSECFCMRRKYLYTYTVCKTAMDRSACHWLAVSVSTWKSSTHKINQVFGIYHVCRSSKVHVSMRKTWITPTANSSYNPPPHTHCNLTRWLLQPPPIRSSHFPSPHGWSYLEMTCQRGW